MKFVRRYMVLNLTKKIPNETSSGDIMKYVIV